MNSLEDWFNLWWQQLRNYKHHFSSGTLGSKASALKQVKLLKPDEQLRKEIMDYTREKAIIWDRKKKQGEQMRFWQDVERMVKNRFWDDDLPASYETNTIHHAERTCHCGEPVHGPSFALCTECLSRSMEKTG